MLSLQALLEKLPDCPVVQHAKPLGGSSVSRKWFLDSDIGPLVLRADEPVAEQLGLDRQREIDAMGAAGPLATEVICAVPEEGLLLVRYVEGSVAEEGELESIARAAELGSLLRELHDRNVSGCRVVDYSAAATRYSRLAGGRQAANLASEAARLAARWCDDRARFVLCHHDPCPGNIVLGPNGGAMRLIDWEYAGLGEPCMDLAAVLSGPVGRVGDELLQAYGSPVDSRRLEGCSTLYRCLATLWLMAVCSATDAPQAYREALRKLREGL